MFVGDRAPSEYPADMQLPRRFHRAPAVVDTSPQQRPGPDELPEQSKLSLEPGTVGSGTDRAPRPEISDPRPGTLRPTCGAPTTIQQYRRERQTNRRPALDMDRVQ